ncbi:MAG: M20/M25/M40 family metallo-hydrolase [Chitinophagaceae bacterium]|nr:MAG: M20/M25/M40 family metallo-hydrolase [Chitinophagaceae bacterium]
MTTFLKFILPVLLFSYQLGFAQTNSSANRKTISNLKEHISYLASDSLEGRRAGTKGEALAQQYIITQFKKIGLEPKGADGFYQPFSIYGGKQINRSTYLIINGDSLTINKDFFPFPFSANSSLVAAPIVSVQEISMPWFFDLKTILEENKTNPHFDLNEAILSTIKKESQKGPSAIIFFNSSEIEDGLAFESKNKTSLFEIPVLYLTKGIIKKYLSDDSATLNIDLKVDVGEIKRRAGNIIGYIDNSAATTVVLGAHFDHLGYGEDGNSMLRTSEKLIHNGADDNTSGTAALIELARKLKSSTLKNNNYLFIAFSAEELGLIGSKYFTENPTIELTRTNYMINLDMVGRLNDSLNSITVGGFGTSPQWNSIINEANKKNSFALKFDSSGTGPSDHTSFYRKDIPVLFFFTGLHTDYHKPGDDFEKINYRGETRLISFIYKIILNTNYTNQKLVFAKTREAQTTTSARFSVSMGIMPDYSYSGAGVRCDGISEGRPAQKAGIRTGDVILQINDYEISSVESYMQVLGKFKKGDRVIVKYSRSGETLITEVQF